MYDPSIRRLGRFEAFSNRKSLPRAKQLPQKEPRGRNILYCMGIAGRVICTIMLKDSMPRAEFVLSLENAGTDESGR